MEPSVWFLGFVFFCLVLILSKPRCCFCLLLILSRYRCWLYLFSFLSSVDSQSLWELVLHQFCYQSKMRSAPTAGLRNHHQTLNHPWPRLPPHPTTPHVRFQEQPKECIIDNGNLKGARWSIALIMSKSRPRKMLILLLWIHSRRIFSWKVL